MKDLEQYKVCATDGDLGSVADFRFEDTSWRVRYVVVKTGSVLHRSQILVESAAIRLVDYSATRLQLALSTSQITNKSHPNPDPLDLPDRFGDPSLDPHLRSAVEAAGYAIEGTDGPVGHLRDLIVDDETWDIHYMVLATGTWWPGQGVLISPMWTTRVDWIDHKVYVGVPRDVIRASPVWNSTYPIEDAYAKELARHYAGTPGWVARDRNVLLGSSGPPSGARSPLDAAAGERLVERANARAATREEAQVRKADDAAIRDAREGRMP